MTQTQLALFDQHQPSPKAPTTPSVREVTLHRLTTACDPENMCQIFEEQNSGRFLAITATQIAGQDAVVAHGLRNGTQPPEWQADARRTTGVDIDLTATDPTVAVLIAVDGKVYGFSYGGGHHLIPQEMRDPQFGRMFAVRALDPASVTAMETRPLDKLSQFDQVRITKGDSFGSYPFQSERDLVKRVKARCVLDGLTAHRAGKPGRPADCGDGIRTSLGVDPHDLVNDIRLFEKAEELEPRADMEVMENQEEVREADVRAQLWELLENGLARPEDVNLAVVPPLELLDRADAETLYFRVTGVRLRQHTPFSPEDVYDHVLRRLRLVFAKHAAPDSLKNTRISIYEYADAKKPVSTAKLQDWLEASLHHEGKLFVLREGHWYRFGARYLDEVNRVVDQTLKEGSSVVFPPWIKRDGTDGKTQECGRAKQCHEAGEKCGKAEKEGHESTYNACVLGAQPGYLCLDTSLAKTPVHSGNGVEVCDVLGPKNQLIHVKQASSASTLSHIFIQGRGAIESLVMESEAREWLLDRVKEADPERDMTGFLPNCVVFGIRLSNYSKVTVDNLYPLAKVELHRTIKILGSRNVKVEVVGIPHA